MNAVETKRLLAALADAHEKRRLKMSWCVRQVSDPIMQRHWRREQTKHRKYRDACKQAIELIEL